MLIDRLSINAPQDEPTIIKVLVAHRTAIDRTFLGLLEGKLVYYEPVPTITRHICHIIVPISLRHTIFNLIHRTHVAEQMREYKTLYWILFPFFCLGYVLMFQIGSRSVLTVCSRIVRDEGNNS